MSNPILASTFLLTLLTFVGLFFFIRASVKARIQVAQFAIAQPAELALQMLQQHFTGRAYRVAAVDAEQQQMTLEGFVRPSVFLAIFLSSLAAIGLLCLAPVLAVLLPQLAGWSLILVLLAPLAGVFYWQKAGRSETVLLKLEATPETAEPVPANDIPQAEVTQSLITVTAHRDEVEQLRRTLMASEASPIG
jgi:hypothetical protein